MEPKVNRKVHPWQVIRCGKPPSDKRSAGMRRDSVRKMSAEADPNPAPRPAGGS